MAQVFCSVTKVYRWCSGQCVLQKSVQLLVSTGRCTAVDRTKMSSREQPACCEGLPNAPMQMEKAVTRLGTPWGQTGNSHRETACIPTDEWGHRWRVGRAASVPPPHTPSTSPWAAQESGLDVPMTLRRVIRCNLNENQHTEICSPGN